MAKTCIGVYCDKAVYSVVLKDSGEIYTQTVTKHDGRLRHFRFIKYLKSFGDFDLCVIVQNEESQPISNYLRREDKRPFMSIEFSPISQQANYKENPDLPTIARKLSYKKKLNDIVFSDDQMELKRKIDELGSGDEAIHMRSLDPDVLAFMAAAHGIFTEDSSQTS
ncbi:MAG: hypothetical protein OEL77_03180 [Nitrosopumilus sp.]|nr:hypothetical protein [Nitrosopumilus sp.]MDH3384999.1 hypothetical protein [Nitrosopumilus sp.]